MGLLETIQLDLTEALKSHDSARAGTLRMLRSAFHNKEIEKRGRGDEPALTEEETIDVVKREVKKRREAGEMYVRAGRDELAQKELAELAILEAYLPEQMDEDDIRKIIGEVLAGFPGATQKDFGKIMGAVMARTGGSADGSIVGKLLREKMQE